MKLSSLKTILGKLPGLAALTLAVSISLAPTAPAHTLVANDSRDGVGLWSWCAINRGTEIDFYRYILEGDNRGVRPFEVFQPPVTPDEIISYDNRLGIRSGQSLQFFDTASSFQHMPQYDFQLPAGTNELVISEDRLGVRTGQTLRFYNISEKYKALPKFDYTVPAGTDELILASYEQATLLGVRTGSTLQFYNVDRGYKADPNLLFTLPPNTDEIAMTGPLLVVMSGDEVDLYNFNQRPLGAPILAMNVGEPTIPPLDTLRGKATVGVTGDDEQYFFDFWAKGNRLRTEEIRDGKKMINIQYGNTLYSYTEGDLTATKGWLGDGIASMALINQIAEVKALGQKGESKEVNGIQYQQYSYQKTPKELMKCTIAITTSLPGTWDVAEMEDGEVIHRSAIFHDLEANVAIPDSTFVLPRNLTIQE